MQKDKKVERSIANLVVIQPTPFCNLDCTYCYLPNRDLKEVIKTETVDNIARVVFSTPNISEHVTIVWHAGEPLTVPRDFYRVAHNIIDKRKPDNVKLTYNFQTNGTLIDDSWCEFFKNDNVKVNVSIDGPEFIHDKNRVNKAGKGTFKQVMNGIGYLQKHNIDFGVLTVLTETSVHYPNEIFDFFSKNKIHRIGFNVEEIEGVNTVSSFKNKESDKQVLKFFETLLRLTDKDESIHIRELDNMVRRIENGSNIMRSDSEPLRIVSFDYKGNVSTFSPELLSNKHYLYGDFAFGNVHNIQNLTDILSNPKFIRVNEDILIGKEACKERCQYYIVCGSGSPSNKIYENNTFKSTETMVCRLQEQVVAEAVLSHLEKRHVKVTELVTIKTQSTV